MEYALHRPLRWLAQVTYKYLAWPSVLELAAAQHRGTLPLWKPNQRLLLTDTREMWLAHSCWCFGIATLTGVLGWASYRTPLNWMTVTSLVAGIGFVVPSLVSIVLLTAMIRWYDNTAPWLARRAALENGRKS